MRIENTQEHDKVLNFMIPAKRQGIADTRGSVTVPSARRGDKGVVNGSVEVPAEHEEHVQALLESDTVIKAWVKDGHILVHGAPAAAATTAAKKGDDKAKGDPAK